MCLVLGHADAARTEAMLQLGGALVMLLSLPLLDDKLTYTYTYIYI